MFERFTEAARDVVLLAQEEARALKQLHRHRASPARVAPRGTRPRGTGTRVSRHHSGGRAYAGHADCRPGRPGQNRADTLHAAREESAGARASQVAVSRHDYIGTEHLLLGIVREKDGVAARILLDLGADAETIREQIIRLLPAGAQAPRRPEPAGAPEPPQVRSRRRVGLALAFLLGVVTGRARRRH
ncbi:MAG TPA: Clp protease N-terminal domain-containing protein [Gaiellaceae bacterium]|nr:Clp protease N-terminal domain-containing protein [Gaiellaceae bacterium]